MSRMRGYQTQVQQGVMQAWGEGCRVVMPVLATGGGKCLGKDTPVLMFDGSVKKVQDVMVGDKLMGPDSTPRNVLSLAYGVDNMYRVTPTKGDSYVVNSEHILSLKKTTTGEIVNIDVQTYLAQNRTFKHLHKGWRTGVSFAERPVCEDLPPYLLGVWLGDGTSQSPAVTTADKEVESYLQEYAAARSMYLRTEDANTGAAKTYHLTHGRKKYPNPLKSALRSYSLLSNKHIPWEYLCNTYDNRMALLAGILDSDGHLHHNGYDVIFKSRRLAEDTAYLARSLGFACYVKQAFKRATNSNHIGDFYNRLFISGDCSVIPTKLTRHQPPARRQKKDVLRTGITVEEIGIGEYFGFEIDSDRLFMLGDFTVTHNTVIMADTARRHQGYGLMAAHRGVLVGQISQALARENIVHNIVGPGNLIKTIVDAHMDEFGKTFFNASARWHVASVDTLKRRNVGRMTDLVTMGMMDEGHHILADNKWGHCLNMFPNAKWMTPTASPKRADGRGLGRHASGLVDRLVFGPTMRELIDWGFLTDYTVRWVQPSDLDLEGIRMSNATGDYNQDEVTARVKHSGMIIGNIVDTYCKNTIGKLAVCFAVDIEHANDIAKRFNEQGVAAEVISADTPEAERRAMLKRFKNRQTLVLVNVDLFGEGFDLPAIEVVIFARPTASLALFIQQFGRVLRLMISPIHMAAWDTYTVEQRKRVIAESGKPVGMVHDHVGNIAHFGGAPDMFTDWNLDDAPKKASKSAADAIPLRPCLNCQMPYMRMYPSCPFCGWTPPLPEARGIKEIDGDLDLLTSEQLRELLGAKAAFYAEPKIPYGASHQVEAGIRNQHANKMHNQAMLQDVMKLVMPPVYDERVNNRKFYLQYGIDTLTAQTLPSADANKLRERILESLRK